MEFSYYVSLLRMDYSCLNRVLGGAWAANWCVRNGCWRLYQYQHQYGVAGLGLHPTTQSTPQFLQEPCERCGRSEQGSGSLCLDLAGALNLGTEDFTISSTYHYYSTKYKYLVSSQGSSTSMRSDEILGLTILHYLLSLAD